MIGDAVISACEQYRYALTREWIPGRPTINWVMLNPSTADHRQDDATIRRCLLFSQAWGYGRLVVTNLFAYRATDPSVLELAFDPVGAENDAAILKHAAAAQAVVVAWGVHGALRARGAEVSHLLKDRQLKCLGVTQAGHPRHPLYLRADTQLEPYLGRAR